MSEPSEWAREKAEDIWRRDDGTCDCLREEPLVGACAGCLVMVIARALDAARAEERDACCRDVCLWCAEHVPEHRFPLLAQPARLIVYEGENRWRHVMVSDSDRSFACSAATIRSRGDA